MTARSDRLARGCGRLRAAGYTRSALGAALLAAAATLVGSCNAITGAGNYSSVTACTGSLCIAQCSAQGGYWNLSTSECKCADGSPVCGGSDGTCCGGTAPHCVTESTGAQRCSACTDVAFECGAVCCEQQSCLNAAIGACGVSFGVSGQSCAGGLVCPIAHPDGTTESADCCESIAIPGGTFEMGRSATGKNRCPATPDLAPADQCEGDETPEHSMTLSAYKLDRFEVTVGRFRRFVDAFDFSAGLPTGAGATSVVAGSGWPSGVNQYLPASRAALETFFGTSSKVTWTSTVGANENKPITGVDWELAFAFCIWDGGRLPTEAEWEFAAANGANADLYPWGEAAPTRALAVYDCSSDAVPCASPPAFPADVGSVPSGANRWGQLDLAGNVGEWTLDTYAPYGTEPMTDFANIAYGFRVFRGGAYDVGSGVPVVLNAIPWPLRAAAREGRASLGIAFYDVGVRCAR
ncbi:MAG: formylglycine-generating enzyme family protein [Polyangiales bacterium]